MRICNSPWKHRHSPKRIGRTGKKNKHLHRTSCGWSPTSASWCMTSRGLSESTTSRKPGVRIGLRLPTLRRTSTEKLSTRQRPYFNPPKCPANKSLNILSIGLGFFQTISSFPGSSFFKLGSWWGDWTIVSISCIDNCLSLSSKVESHARFACSWSVTLICVVSTCLPSFCLTKSMQNS